MPFEKGKSGNPLGRIPGVSVQALLGPLREQSLANIKKYLEDDQNPRLQWEVTQWWFDRMYGKVVERREVSGADGGAIKIEDNTPSITLLLQQALAPPTSPAPVTIDADDDGKDA